MMFGRGHQGFFIGGTDGVLRFYSNNGAADTSKNINLTTLNAGYEKVWGLDYKDGFLYVLVELGLPRYLIKIRLSDSTTVITSGALIAGYYGTLVRDDGNVQLVSLARSERSQFFIIYSKSDFSDTGSRVFLEGYVPSKKFVSITQYNGYYYLLSTTRKIEAYPKPAE